MLINTYTKTQTGQWTQLSMMVQVWTSRTTAMSQKLPRPLAKLCLSKPAAAAGVAGTAAAGAAAAAEEESGQK